ERQLARCLEHSAGTQRKATVAHVMVVMKVRPRSADIIIFKEGRIPGTAVEDIPVPLYAQCVRCSDVLDQTSQHEARIIVARPDRLDLSPADPWLLGGGRPIAEEKYLGEVRLR